MLGSHNFTTAGVVYNRDASLIVEDAGVAAYFREIFEFDWARTASRRVSTARHRDARPVIEVPPGAEAAAPAGYVRMDWHDWTGE
jgi:phosphatidylserine/phosphatidylglycerophosphate/cardiolipin synthase-like enzyme